jgi:hypothetical protein
MGKGSVPKNVMRIGKGVRNVYTAPTPNRPGRVYYTDKSRGMCQYGICRVVGCTVL